MSPLVPSGQYLKHAMSDSIDPYYHQPFCPKGNGSFLDYRAVYLVRPESDRK